MRKRKRRTYTAPVERVSLTEVIKCMLVCDPADQAQIDELLSLSTGRVISSFMARRMFKAPAEAFRVWAVRCMRDQREIYRVAKTSQDLAVRKEAIERLRSVVFLKRLLHYETHPVLRARVQERFDWQARQNAEARARWEASLDTRAKSQAAR